MSRFRVALVDYYSDLYDISPTSLAAMESTLGEVGATLEISQSTTEDDVIAAGAGADLVMIQTDKSLLTGRVIESYTRCRGIVRLGVGYDSVAVGAATLAGIPVSNVIDWSTDEVAEHALALLLATARKIGAVSHNLRLGKWDREVIVPVHRIRGSTLGIVAFGKIGQAVAQRAAALGVTIIVRSGHADAATLRQHGIEKVELDELLRRSDIISLHCSLTDETHHLLGPREFELMKDGVVIVNTSRGAVIDETALIAALRSGKVRAAGLDVMTEEPLAADSPLRDMDQVILTPHCASYSVEAVETVYRMGARIGADLLSQRWPSTIVNPEVRAKAEERWGKYTSVAEG